MLTKCLSLTGLLLGLAAAPLHAQDHLVPATGYFSSYDYASGYYSKVQQILLKGLTDSPMLRVVVVPSFAPEYVISLEQTNQTYTLRCVESRTSIWGAVQTKSAAPVGVESHAAVISPETARAVAEAFNAAIDQAHYPAPATRRILTDGVVYHFVSFRVGLGLREGTAHSPAHGSNLALLVQLTGRLQQLALQSAGQPTEAELTRLAQAVTATFTAPPTAK